MPSKDPSNIHKNYGRIYTPNNIVCLVLDFVGYTIDKPINSYKIIDPACGDGAFLSEIALRIYNYYQQNNITDYDLIKQTIIDNIWGIEIDEKEVQKAKENIVNTLIENDNHFNIASDDLIHIIQGDTLDIISSDNTKNNYIDNFDFVVGNPPYIRIHNIEKDSNILPSWCKTGMTDLYYAFFQLGIELCKDNGKLCYIAPSSWFTNKAAKPMREYLHNANIISGIIDLEHIQVFDNAQTYTAIVRIEKDNTNLNIDYYLYSELDSYSSINKQTPHNILDIDNIWIDDYFIPSSSAYQSKIKDILEQEQNDNHSIVVRNGFATNLDKFYIRDEFELGIAPQDTIIDVVKSSTGKTCKAFFPYYKNPSNNEILLYPLSHFMEYDIYQELKDNEQALKNRSQVPIDNWHMYARSQGIQDVFKDKIALNLLYRTCDDIKIVEAPKGIGVYGGIYVMGMEKEELEKALYDPLYLEYVKTLRKYKSGGYYSLGGKDLEKYLRWYYKENFIP